MKAKQLSINAILVAMCVVLGCLALGTNIIISFESLPVLVSALLFGPVNGILVWGIGSLVYQLLRCGAILPVLIKPLGQLADRCKQ